MLLYNLLFSLNTVVGMYKSEVPENLFKSRYSGPTCMKTYLEGIISWAFAHVTEYSLKTWFLIAAQNSRVGLNFLNLILQTSLVAQWLRIHLPMQGTRVRSLVWKDPTCHGATKPVRHNYWACTLEPASHNYWACMPQLLKPAHLESMLHKEKPLQWEACTPQGRVAPARRN